MDLDDSLFAPNNVHTTGIPNIFRRPQKRVRAQENDDGSISRVVITTRVVSFSIKCMTFVDPVFVGLSAERVEYD